MYEYALKAAEVAKNLENRLFFNEKEQKIAENCQEKTAGAEDAAVLPLRMAVRGIRLGGSLADTRNILIVNHAMSGENSEETPSQEENAPKTTEDPREIAGSEADRGLADRFMGYHYTPAGYRYTEIDRGDGTMYLHTPDSLADFPREDGDQVMPMPGTLPGSSMQVLWRPKHAW